MRKTDEQVYTADDIAALTARIHRLEDSLREANRRYVEARSLLVEMEPPVTVRTSWDRVPGWVVVLLLAGFAVGMAIGVNVRPLR